MELIERLVRDTMSTIEAVAASDPRNHDFAISCVGSLFESGGPGACDHLLFCLERERPDDRIFYLQAYICVLSDKGEFDEALLRAAEILEDRTIDADSRAYQFVVAALSIEDLLTDPRAKKDLFARAQRIASVITEDHIRVLAYLELGVAAADPADIKRYDKLMREILHRAYDRGDFFTVAHGWISIAHHTQDEPEFRNALDAINLVTSAKDREILTEYLQEGLEEAEPEIARKIVECMPSPKERAQTLDRLRRRDVQRALN